MWVSKVRLNEVRCFDNEEINLSKGINVFVGENNSGKSTILHAVRLIQDIEALKRSDIRLRAINGYAYITLEGDLEKYFEGGKKSTREVSIEFRNKNLRLKLEDGNDVGRSQISKNEPDNFIYPYLSKRKVVAYEEGVNVANASSVEGNFQHLYSKVDRISNPEFGPGHREYLEACDNILGFRVTSSPSESGKKATYTVKSIENIPLDSMGEGVANILGLIVDLCVAEEKLFLIEEPENDIHPGALKGLLSLIIDKSESNQFLITTHSHIVTTLLGGVEGSKLFDVSTSLKGRMFTSEVKEIENSVEERSVVLERLGYVPFDLEMWDAWLFLEESSAEKIIKEYLMKWFTPSLKRKIKTFSAGSLSRVERRFAAFNDLFAYANLTPVYRNRAWVVIDGGEEEKRIIEKLKEVYKKSGWEDEQFLQFSEHDFERYYPKEFEGRIGEVLNIDDRQSKREEKKNLLVEVEEWIKTDEERAIKEFESSANDVIEILKKIEASIDRK